VKVFDIVIIGGGLAGLTAALHLKQKGFEVLVIEKNNYPHHKVCGEYVSNEVIPYLEHLGINDLDKYPNINRLQISTRSGKSVYTQLPLGGIGVSRYTLDYSMYKVAKKKGVSFLFETVSALSFKNDIFDIITALATNVQAKIVIGAYGKRSNLDKKLNRKFIQQKSPWLGVKCHYQANDFPDDLVALHNFKGGYGGLSKTEDSSVNFCYLTNFKSFKKYNSIEDFNANIVCENPFLEKFLHTAKPRFKKPLSIAQISFEQKNTVENHILMCGDSSGLIHPLCGNGMAMAIHGAKIASECIIDYFGKANQNRLLLEKTYEKLWYTEFSNRLRMGRYVQRLLINNTVSEIAMGSIAKSEKILQAMIQRTHGNPILVS